MTPDEARKWVNKVIRQRMHTVNHDCCYRNKLQMVNTCQRLKMLLDANAYKGDKIFEFIRRHHIDLILIIPANSSESLNYKILNEISPCNLNQNIKPKNQVPTQLYMQL